MISYQIIYYTACYHAILHYIISSIYSLEIVVGEIVVKSGR